MDYTTTKAKDTGIKIQISKCTIIIIIIMKLGPCILGPCYAWLDMMHHAVPQGTIVPWGNALCSAILRSPQVKSCRMIWCVVQREHFVENACDIFAFKYFQRLLSTQFIHSKSFWIFYCAFYKNILHFLNPDSALKNKINNYTKWQIFTWYPRVRFMSPFVGFCFL